jgi:hypothetical protein
MKITLATNDGVVLGTVYDQPGIDTEVVWIDTVQANDEVVAESDREMFGGPVIVPFADIVEHARRMERADA